MSRPLVSIALLVFALAGLLPLAIMLGRISPDDLSALASWRILSLLGRTVRLGLGASLFALTLGLPFGFLVARTDIPGARTLRALGVVPLLLPPLFLAMTWSVLWRGLVGPPAAVFCLGLSTFPLVAIFSARAFERIDARSEEAALLVGGLGAALRMELPLVLPAALAGAALAFAFAVNDFAVPDYLSWDGPKFNVYADEIFLNWTLAQESGSAGGLAMASALPLIALTLLALVPALRLRRRGAFTTLGSDFRTPTRLALGAWRLPAFAFCLGVVVLGCVLPLGRLLWEAAELPKHTAADASIAGTPLFTAVLQSLRATFAMALDQAREDIGRSLVYAAVAAALAAPLGLVLGHAIERISRPRLGRGLELLALLPLAAPAIGFSIGGIAAWNREWTAGFYQSGAMPIWMYLGRFATFAVLLSSGAAAALSPALEEAGALAGAGPTRRMLAIVAPCLRGTLVAGFLLVFVFAMRDLDSAILVPAANKTAVCRLFNALHFGRQGFIAALSLLIAFAILLPGLLWLVFARRRLEVLP